VHAGDATMGGEEESLVACIDWLAAQPARTKLFVAGNHDFFTENDQAATRRIMRARGVAYLVDETATLEGLRVHGSPVQPWFCDWAWNRQRGEEIRRHWERIPTGLDILVTHGPPWGVLDLAPGDRTVGCEELMKVIEATRPRLHVFGHIHEGFGIARPHGSPTLFVNASIGYKSERAGRRPIVVDVPPEGAIRVVDDGGAQLHGHLG